ncbi:hypothetical protein BRD00_13110 [Halobacteriales archaeon QS_8_69_26]|nr:MAG: hypothetical protein BRD00_13110 [Halobacteriales archaeon QS_8_69_26]
MNVLVYVVDALRADALSCYGYDRDTTPAIDHLAANGVRYERCFSPSTWTRPVAASILTGLYPPAHGVVTRDDGFEGPSVATAFANRGHDAVGVSAMGNVSTAVGFDRGFDAFHDLYRDPAVVERRETRDADAEELDQESVEEVALPRAADVTDRLLSWLDGREAHPDDPFFALCWAIDPHVPYDPPDGYREYVDPDYDGPVDGRRETLPEVNDDADLAHLRSLYDGEVRYVDDQIRRLVEGLDDRNLGRDTLLVVLGDHGDAFREHGRLTHGHLPYDELMRVPLVVAPATAGDGRDGIRDRRDETPETSAGLLPGTDGVDPPVVVDEVTSLVDLAPTLLAAAGADPGSRDGPVQGRPLPPFGPEGSSAPVYSETRLRDSYPVFYGVRTDRWKYMAVEGPDGGPGTYLELARRLVTRGMVTDLLRHPLYYLRRYRHDEDEYLFDLDADPGETENLTGDRPETASEFRERLQEWRTNCAGIRDRLSSRQDVSDGGDRETEEQLRRLGYVD